MVFDFALSDVEYLEDDPDSRQGCDLARIQNIKFGSTCGFSGLLQNVNALRSKGIKYAKDICRLMNLLSSEFEI